MTTHRSSWLLVCSLFIMPGLAMSLTWPTTSVLALFAACAFLIGIARVHYNLSMIDATALPPLRVVTAGVASSAAVGGVVMLAFVGLSDLIGAWVLLVCSLLAGSSPVAVRIYRRRSGRVGVDDGHRPGSVHLLPTGHLSCVAERDARELTDAELCQVWRASSDALRAATSPALQARVVESRQRYLDEVARRHPAGLHAWMSPGAGALDDVRPVLCADTGQGGGGIDWDALVFGQDDT